MQATLNSIIFNENKFTTYLASQKISDFNNLPVKIIIPESFIIDVKSTSTTPWLEKELEISLSGEVIIKWNYDPETIKTSLVGKKWTEIAEIESKYAESVSGLDAHFTPFWQVFFPDDISRITIEE